MAALEGADGVSMLIQRTLFKWQNCLQSPGQDFFLICLNY